MAMTWSTPAMLAACAAIGAASLASTTMSTLAPAIALAALTQRATAELS
jgi:hypothetical protein